jgi:hypothetical protein
MERLKMSIKREHIEVMESVNGGADIYGYLEATLLREVQKHDAELVQILTIHELEKATGRKFDGAKQLPYFGAILTKKGIDLVNKFKLQGEEMSSDLMKEQE